MIVKLKTNSQITLPRNIVNSLGLLEGDKLEIYEKDGIICLVPVVEYSKEYLNEIHDEINRLKQNINEGKQPTFDNIDALTENLEK